MASSPKTYTLADEISVTIPSSIEDLTSGDIKLTQFPDDTKSNYKSIYSSNEPSSVTKLGSSTLPTKYSPNVSATKPSSVPVPTKYSPNVSATKPSSVPVPTKSSPNVSATKPSSVPVPSTKSTSDAYSTGNILNAQGLAPKPQGPPPKPTKPSKLFFSETNVNSDEPNQGDVEDIFANITLILIKNAALEAPKELDDLKLDGKEINVKCFLSQLSNGNISTVEQCAEYASYDYILNYTAKSLASENKYFYVLHSLILHLVNHIPNSKEFGEADSVVQYNTLKNVQNFIISTAEQYNEFINDNVIINKALANKTYDLLYLSNEITKKLASNGKNFAELASIYSRVKKAIEENIKLHNELVKRGVKTDNTTASVDGLIEKLKILETEQANLNEHITQLTENNEKISPFISAGAKNVGSAIEKIKLKSAKTNLTSVTLP